MARKKRSIAEIFGAWPPAWSGSYQPYDEIVMDPDSAQLESARESGRILTINARQGGRIASSSIKVEDDELRKGAVVVLSESKGMTIRAIGSLEVDTQK